MKKSNIGYAAGMAAAVLAYILVMWVLLFFLFMLSKNIPEFPRFNILSGATLLPLAIGSLLSVFCAEYLLCKRLAIPWILVRLVTPCIGFILFLATLIVVFPVLLQNMFILFPVILFMLVQGGVLLISICFTAILNRMRKSWDGSLEQDFSSDPKLRPIKLSPHMEQKTPQLVSKTTHPRKRDWKSGILVAAAVAVIGGGMAVMLIWFPSYQTALMILPAVTRADTAQPGHWNGRRAAEDIPRLTGLNQLEDGTFDGSTYLTVETDQLIPLSYYKLKDISDSRRSGSNGYAQRRSGRPLSVYTDFAGVNAMYYGQYYLAALGDGSYIGAYLDSSYHTAFGKVQLPIGQVRSASNVESDLLMKAAGTYSVPTDCLLMMHDDSYYENIKMLDHGIRLVAIVFVPAVAFCLAVLWSRRKKHDR